MSEEIKKLNRAAVRALAEKHSDELRQIASSGGNPYQASLDHQDKIDEFISSMSEDEAIAFIDMYTEEIDACTQNTEDETTRILAETEANNYTAEAIGGFIGFAILLFIIFSILN